MEENKIVPVLTCKQGINADLFPEVLRLYVQEGATIADVTFGRGVFWKKIESGKYSLLPTDLATGTDARNLPYENESLDALVFDPPYMPWSGSIKESISKCYNNNRPVSQYKNAERTGNDQIKKWQDVIQLYMEVSREARRVLKTGGILILKTQDTVTGGKQRWFHIPLMSLAGFECEDLFVLMQNGTPAMDTKWKKQYHARKNHSYFIVHRKLTDKQLFHCSHSSTPTPAPIEPEPTPIHPG